MSKTIIVVGLSAASMAFITKLRTFDQSSKIIAFSAENDFPYNRCLLADFLTEESTLKEIELKPQDFFEKNNIEVHFNTKVDRIDSKNNMVFVKDRSYGYDNLFLGIGTYPFIPQPFKNLSCEEIFTFHTLEDMQKIASFIEQQRPKSAVVIGAGLNGIEAASSLASKGLAVTIIEAQKNILPGQVDPQSARWVAHHALGKGITIIQGYKAVGIFQEDQILKGVKIETGTQISTDMLIVAAGSALHNQLIDGTGIQLMNGSIVVNQNMQTTISNIFAGGDICAVPDMISKKLTRSTTWSDAMLQGLCAATALSQAPRAYPGMIGLRDSYFFGRNFYACGDTAGQSDFIRTVCKETQDDLEILFTQDGILRGFILIGDISRVAELKKLYLSQITCV